MTSHQPGTNFLKGFLCRYQMTQSWAMRRGLSEANMSQIFSLLWAHSLIGPKVLLERKNTQKNKPSEKLEKCNVCRALRASEVTKIVILLFRGWCDPGLGGCWRQVREKWVWLYPRGLLGTLVVGGVGSYKIGSESVSCWAKETRVTVFLFLDSSFKEVGWKPAFK